MIQEGPGGRLRDFSQGSRFSSAYLCNYEAYMNRVFVPRPPFSIDWERPYSVGPSDEHLHAIGQFIANYSYVEFQIAEVFSFLLKLSVSESQTFIAELQLSQSGISRYIKKKCETSTSYDKQALADLSKTMEKFSQLTAFRNQVVHWHWGLDEGETATITDLIKPRSPGKKVEVSLQAIRDRCLDLMSIFQSIAFNLMILRDPKARLQILEIRSDTSHEKLFQGSRK